MPTNAPPPNAVERSVGVGSVFVGSRVGAQGEMGLAGSAEAVEPLIVTKLVPPRLHERLVSRPRLLELLNQGAGRPVTIVSGGAGAGKTLAVASWVELGRPPGPVAWVSLDADDNDPARFWSHVLAALRSSGAIPADNPLADLVPLQPPSEAFYGRLAGGLAQLLQPVVVVLDDLHQVTDRLGAAAARRVAAPPGSDAAAGSHHPGRPAAAAGPAAAGRAAHRDPRRRPGVHGTGSGSPVRPERAGDQPGRDRQADRAHRGMGGGATACRFVLRGQRGDRPRPSRDSRTWWTSSWATTKPSSTTCSTRCCQECRKRTGTSFFGPAWWTRFAPTSRRRLPDARTASACWRPWNGPTPSSSPSAGAAIWFRYHQLFREALRHEFRLRGAGAGPRDPPGGRGLVQRPRRADPGASARDRGAGLGLRRRASHSLAAPAHPRPGPRDAMRADRPAAGRADSSPCRAQPGYRPAGLPSARSGEHVAPGGRRCPTRRARG